jgi:hypothetical protein
MIKAKQVVRYRKHNYTVECVINRGAYVTALLHIGNKQRVEVPLEQLEEIAK